MKGILLFTALALAAPLPLRADEGWRPLVLRIETGTAAAACALGIAHWYEHTGGPVGPVSELDIPLSVRPSTGEVGMENEAGRKMLLEQIICGDAGLSRATWHPLDIDFLRQSRDVATIRCNGVPLSCRWGR